MQVLIDRKRRSTKLPSGWFARYDQPLYDVWLAISFSEEERFLLTHTGLGPQVFFQAPIPPDVISDRQIEKMKAQKAGLYFLRDLLRFTKPHLIGTWPNLIAADDAEAAIRIKLEELAIQLERARETTETSKVFTP